MLHSQWSSGWCSRHDHKRFELEATDQDHYEGLFGVILETSPRITERFILALLEHQDIFSSLAALPGEKNCARKRVVRSSKVEMDPAGRRSSQLIAWPRREKQNRRKRVVFLVAPFRWCQIAGGHLGSFGKLNGVAVALVDRSGRRQKLDAVVVRLQQEVLQLPRAKVTAIEEVKDLATLLHDELINNLKLYEMVLENDGIVSKTTKEKVNSLALKAKVTREQTSDDSDSQGVNDEDEDEDKINELKLEVKKLNKAKEVVEPCQKCNALTQEVDSLKGNVSMLQGEALNFSEFKKSSIVLDDMLSHQKVFQDKEGLKFSKNEKTNYVCLKCDLRSDYWIVDSGYTKYMTRNRRLFTTYKEYDGGHVVFGSNLKGKVIDRDLRADIELKDALIVAIPKLEGDGYILNTVRVEYEWKPPRCRVFGLNGMTCPNRVVDEPKKQTVKNNDGFQHAPKRASHSFHIGGTKTRAKTCRPEASTSNPFDALNTIDIDDVLREKGVNTIHADMVDNSIPNVDIGSLGAKGEETGRSSSKSRSGTGRKSLYECWKDDYDDNPYGDDDEREDLTEDQLAFSNAFDIGFRGQIRQELYLVQFLSQMYSSV
ncbi:hypothetical protein Tco_1024470 [Tanacetum coccineum]